MSSRAIRAPIRSSSGPGASNGSPAYDARSVRAWAAPNPAVAQGRGVQHAPPGHGDHGDAGATRGGRHAGGGLAVQGLCVEGALAGDHQVGADDRRLEPGQLLHHLGARPQLGPEHGHGAEPDAAGCAGPGRVAQVAAGRPRDDVGEPAELGVERGDLLGRRALLRVRRPRPPPSGRSAGCRRRRPP